MAQGLIAVIGDQDTVNGFLLAGVGKRDQELGNNYLTVNEDTDVQLIKEKFDALTKRKDISIILINQNIANAIREEVSAYKEKYPVVLELPSKDEPYDPTNDAILSRAKVIHKFNIKRLVVITMNVRDTPIMLIAQYDFVAENESELGFKKNDVIQFVKALNDEWYEGIITSDHQIRKGFFPKTYVAQQDRTQQLFVSAPKSEEEIINELNELLSNASKMIHTDGATNQRLEEMFEQCMSVYKPKLEKRLAHLTKVDERLTNINGSLCEASEKYERLCKEGNLALGL